jgi:hypothetical protein
LGLTAGLDVSEKILLLLTGLEPPSYPGPFDYPAPKLKISNNNNNNNIKNTATGCHPDCS